jgi:hypothetical protein
MFGYIEQGKECHWLKLFDWGYIWGNKYFLMGIMCFVQDITPNKIKHFFSNTLKMFHCIHQGVFTFWVHLHSPISLLHYCVILNLYQNVCLNIVSHYFTTTVTLLGLGLEYIFSTSSLSKEESFLDETAKPEASCHSICGTTKLSPCSKAVGVYTSCSPSPAVLTSFLVKKLQH